ncbi:sialidase family protein [Amycolatopsis australiensis]|uniref:Photosynthesis system II assembly factor Ycf48/Hcf136-like domain-containing protein n=1 Tax=Amycolatopsis australiensis TaxID=546364 RepID=A0A1K1RN68_9PSEU|nr:hypothetical protein [Amycolatopsis australiensis]SFW73362.1 hypothetical protein SAMN04489730_3602 [Amycolatopsis australiensis]
MRTALLVSLLTLLTGFAAPAAADPAVPPGFRPASTSWTGPAAGYVLGYVPCANSWCPALLATADGGRHWRRLGAPPMALPDNHNHVALTVISDRVAYVSDGVHLLATRDSGVSWHPLGLLGAREPYYLAKVAEAGGRVFAVLTTFGDGRGSTLLYSAAAGVPVLAPVPGFAVTGGITYGDVATGGGVQVSLGADYGTERYWTSRDGVRFTPADPPCPPGTVASLAGVRDRQVVALCGSSPGSPQPGSTARSLRHAPSLGGVFSGGDAAPAAGITQGFAAASPSSATVAAEGGGSGFLHRTADGGRTWTTTVLSDRGLSLTDLDFPGGGTGVVVDGRPDADGGSAVYRTTDDGRTWREVRFGA